MGTFFTVATERGTVVTSARVALLVGSILALINYGDRIFLHGNMGTLERVSEETPAMKENGKPERI